MKILLVGQNLQIGGVQTALVNLLKNLSSKDNIELDLFLFGEGDLVSEVKELVEIKQGSKSLRLVATPFREVLKSRNLTDLSHRLLLMILVRVVKPARLYSWLFRKEVDLGTYDIAISYFNDVPHAYFNQGTNQFVRDHVTAPVKLAWIHTDPVQAGFDKDACRNVYRDFDALICVSYACAEKMKAFLPEYSEKIRTVYNLFPIEEIQVKGSLPEVSESHQADKHLTFITVTRVENGSKNLKRIVTVCSKLEKEGLKSYQWIVLGDGPDLEKNRREIKEAGLGSRVKYIGARTNPYPYIARSDLFILTSNYEGFPMVIQEALILGVPVLTTPYAAVREQVIDGKNGIVTEMSSESIYRHLKEILEKPEILEDLKATISAYPVSNVKADDQLSELFIT